MIEEIDTNNDFSNKVIPDGPHHCKVINTRKVKSGFVFALAYDGDQSGEIMLFGNQMGDLLKALGCAEGSAPGKYVLNTDITDGGEFDAVFFTEKNYKRMKDIKGSGVGY
jgi:hypothetical protein